MLGLSAKDIMTRDVVTIRKGAPVEEAMTLMAKHHVSGLPVIDPNGCVEGIITESDVLLKGQSRVPHSTNKLGGRRGVSDEVVEDMYRRAKADLVQDAMTSDVITFGEDSAVADIARVMIEHNINRIPIIRDCRVVGIVSRRDIVKAMAKMMNGPAMEDTTRKQKVIEL